LTVVIVCLAVTNGFVLFEIAQIVGWRMRIVPEALVGRVFGAVRLVVLIGTVPGAIIGGALADTYGARVPILVSGAGYLALALIVWFVRPIRDERR
jgi:predicted MFS family arabinose efflux permease